MICENEKTCNLPDDSNELKVLVCMLEKEVKELVKSTEASILIQNGKIAECCSYLKENLSNSIRCLLADMKLSGDLEAIITQILLNDFINVEKYGIVGDGKTDNSEKLKVLLESLKEGDIVYFPKGTYICKTDIVIPNSKIKIYGSGRDHSIIDLTSGSIEFKGNNIVLKDLQIKNAKYTKLNGYHSTIEASTFTGCEIALHLVNGYITQILNSYITYNKIGVFYEGQSYEAIIDNSVVDNNEIGVIYGGDSSGARITNSTVEGNRNRETGIGCGIVISNISTDIKIDKCWFESNGFSDSAADIFFNSSIHNPILDPLYNFIESLCPKLYPLDCCGSVVIENSHFLFTKYGIAIAGAETNIYIKGNYFNGEIDKYNKPIDIYTKTLSSSKITCLSNTVLNSNNRIIDSQMLNGVKSSYIYTDLKAKENELEKLINGVITIDNEPLFLYKGKLSDLTNVKYVYQYQGANEGATYNAGILNGTHLTNSYNEKTGAIYITETKGINKPIFTSTGNTEFIVIGSTNSEINFRYGENTPTIVKPLNYDIFRINRFNLYSKEAFANNIKQVFFAVIELTEEEKLKMKQCLAFKPSDVHYSIINNGEI